MIAQAKRTDTARKPRRVNVSRVLFCKLCLYASGYRPPVKRQAKLNAYDGRRLRLEAAKCRRNKPLRLPAAQRLSAITGETRRATSAPADSLKHCPAC